MNADWHPDETQDQLTVTKQYQQIAQHSMPEHSGSPQQQNMKNGEQNLKECEHQITAVSDAT